MKTLRYGSTGPQVELLQLALNRSGDLQSPPDGLFGPETRSAVLRFQQRSGLQADGVVGPRTWQALNPWLTGYRTVNVRSGDSLFRIAQRYGSSLRAVEIANPGIDPLQLRIGQQITVPLNFPVVPENIRFTSTVLNYVIRGLQARYPFLTTGGIGRSVLGKPLSLILIGRGSNQVFFNASHHANEWITTPVLMKFLERYAYAYAFGEGIGGTAAETLYNGSTLSIVPMVNPDGVDLVTGELGPDSQAYYRALELNGGRPGFPDNWKANIRGVDLNLQYPAGWEEAREIKFSEGYTSPGPRDYVGAAPLTEPESRAVYEYTLENDFALSLSYHTQGEVIYWKFSDFQPPRSLEIGQELSRLSGYSLELTPERSAYAGYKDWFIQQYNRPSYTVEAGLGASPLPLSQFPQIYRDNEALLSYALTPGITEG